MAFSISPRDRQKKTSCPKIHAQNVCLAKPSGVHGIFLNIKVIWSRFREKYH